MARIMKRIGYQATAMTGSFLLGLGEFCAGFSTHSVPAMFVTQGFLFGTGAALLFLVGLPHLIEIAHSTLTYTPASSYGPIPLVQEEARSGYRCGVWRCRCWLGCHRTLTREVDRYDWTRDRPQSSGRLRVGHLSASRLLLEAANRRSRSRFEDAMVSHLLVHYEFLLTVYDQAAGTKSEIYLDADHGSCGHFPAVCATISATALCLVTWSVGPDWSINSGSMEFRQYTGSHRHGLWG